ncbi:MAG TPA: UDP-N-acetylmuramoyl-tripeptide--D-alanyl-D-alanine ligase [Saprospiraceae bacterium]|nr:UDP-N-acetylmuramoyl-tripeptide--D-alanyl-D-alanine ligase [Saprospiraceae bacterium]
MNSESLYPVFLKHPWISTDTRQIKEGSLFFALRGDHFDGNAFAIEALALGAAYAIVSDQSLKGSRFIYVPDTLLALQQLAREHRQHCSIPVIAITGSNGKTTTKELLHAVLSRKFKTYATQGNLNNHIGVPLTLLQVQFQTEILICEMGANHAGEIAALCSIADPTHGLITNIGKAHLEGFGSLEGVKKAKGELFDYLAAHQGFAFVNADDSSLVAISESLHQKTSYGLKDESSPEIHFQYTPDHLGGFVLKDRHSDYTIHSSLFGFYNASNILAAYCVGKYFGVEEELITDSLSSFVSGANRSEKMNWKECTIIKDAYNANPSSMELAVHAFAEQYPEGWVILGDMKELGSATHEAHHQMIKTVLGKKIKKIFFVGNAFREAYLKMHLKDPRVEINNTIEELIDHWKWDSCRGQHLLLKGSRSMHLEKILG